MARTYRQVRAPVLVTGSELGHVIAAEGIGKIMTKPLDTLELKRVLLEPGG